MFRIYMQRTLQKLQETPPEELEQISLKEQHLELINIYCGGMSRLQQLAKVESELMWSAYPG